jgi:hypothetical protein
MRAKIFQALHIDNEVLSDKYLGLPALVRADRSDSFKHFIERIIARINGWKEKYLSIGGKQILLKAVAQAIPVYATSVFQIPKGVCKRIMDAISIFWWGDDDNSNKMHHTFLKTRDEWDLEISIHSIWPCWQRKYGG